MFISIFKPIFKQQTKGYKQTETKSPKRQSAFNGCQFIIFPFCFRSSKSTTKAKHEKKNGKNLYLLYVRKLTATVKERNIEREIECKYFHKWKCLLSIILLLSRFNIPSTLSIHSQSYKCKECSSFEACVTNFAKRILYKWTSQLSQQQNKW